MPVNAGTIWASIRIRLDKLNADINKVESRMNQFGQQNKTAANGMEQSWSKSFGGINLAGVAAFTGLGLAVKGAIGTFAGFEQSMANVQSVARGTPAEFAALEQAAKEAGETTRFTASQAADALYNLASAGLTAKQSTEALNGVLQLAGATGSDLASTTATVASTLSQFSLEAEESGRISNVFAAAIENSQANMDKLTNAFRQVGPVAGAMGLSLEETTGAMQVLFNAGFQGEQAGTILRNMLSELSNSTGPASKKLVELGVNIEKLDPSVNSLSDIIGTLSEAGLDAGEVMSVFGARTGPGLLTLISAGKEGIEEYTEAITGTEAAAEAYAIQNDTLAGSLDMMKSAAEGAQISFTEALAPAMKAVVDAGTKVIGIISGLPTPVTVFTGVLAIAIPVIGLATSAVTMLGGAFAFMLGPVGLVLAGVAGLTAAFAGISNAVKKNRIEFVAKEYGTLAEEIGVTTERMSELEKEARNLGATDENVREVIKAVKELQDELGVTSDEITYASDTMNRVFTTSAYSAAEAVDMITESAGLSREAVIKIGIASGQITGEFRDQLVQQRNIIDRNRTRMEQELQIRDYIEEQKRLLSEGKVGAAALITAEEERTRRQARLINELKEVDRLTQGGIYTEVEGLEKKIELREDLIRAIQEEAAETGKINATSVKQLQDSRKMIELYTAEIERLTGEKKKIGEAEKIAIDLLDQYQQKINAVTLEQEELQDAEIERVRKMLASSGVEQAAIDAVIAKVKEYHEALADETAIKKHEELLESLKNTIFNSFSGMTNALIDLINNVYDAKAIRLDQDMQAELEANGLSEETAVEKAEKQVERARETGDAEAIQEAENALKKAQIEEKYAKKKEQVEYEGAVFAWNIQRLQAVASAALAVMNAYAAGFKFGPIVAQSYAAAAGIIGAIQLAAVQAARPVKSYQTGGIVRATGGGQEGRLAENGYDEYLFNMGPSGDAFARQQAGLVAEYLIAAGIFKRSIDFTLEVDSVALAKVIAPVFENGQVRLKI